MENFQDLPGKVLEYRNEVQTLGRWRWIWFQENDHIRNII